MNSLVDQSAQQNAVMNHAGSDPFGAGADAGMSTYVKFRGASGEYLAGSDEDELPHGTKLIANIFEARWIWSFWWDGKVLGTVDELLRDNPLLNKHMPQFLPEDPDGEIDMTLEEICKMQKEDPANFRDGWSVQASFEMLSMDGNDDEYTMRLGGGVSIRGFDALRKAFGRRYKIEAGKDPVIELTTNKYKSKVKGVGTRHAPVMKIVQWLSPEDMMAATGENEEDYEDDVADTVDASVAETPEAETSKEAPAGRAARRGARGKNLG